MKFFTLLAVAFLAPVFAIAAGQIRIVNNEGQPISGATIIIGNEVGDDQGRTLVTDINGYFPIPNDWKSLQSLSIKAQNYIPTSFLMVEPQETELQLHRKDSRRYYEVKGNAVGFEGIKKDGKVDVGLAYPALSRRDLLQFDISSVISPETDTIKIITEKVGVPSNLSLPKQKESYVLPITLNKPQYRMFVRQPGTYRVMANHGQFPLKRVIKEIKAGKSIFDVINLFRFKSAGQMEMTITDDMTGQDISVNQIKFDQTVDMLAPQIPEKTGIVSASMVDQGGLFFPTDIKGLKSGEASQLKIPQGSKAFVLSLLTQEPEKGSHIEINGAFRKQEAMQNNDISTMMNFIVKSFDLSQLPVKEQPKLDGVSMAFDSANGTVSPNFLDLVAKPVRHDDRNFTMNVPTSLDGIQPVAIYLMLSEIESSNGGENDYAAEKRFRVWESFQTGWPTDVKLPHLDISLEEGKQYRWEVMFLGRKADFNDNPGYFLDGITHVSRTSLDL